MPYLLTVTPLRNGTFDHKVTDPSGTVIGTRNSKKHYVSATVARWNRAAELKSAQWYTDKPEYMATEKQRAHYGEKLARVEDLIARDEQFPTFILSFNNKPTKLTSSQAGCYDFLGYAIESAQAQIAATQGVSMAATWSVSVPGIGHPADTFVIVAPTVEAAKDQARSAYVAKHGVKPQALHTSRMY